MNNNDVINKIKEYVKKEDNCEIWLGRTTKGSNCSLKLLYLLINYYIFLKFI